VGHWGQGVGVVAGWAISHTVPTSIPWAQISCTTGLASTGSGVGEGGANWVAMARAAISTSGGNVPGTLTMGKEAGDLGVAEANGVADDNSVDHVKRRTPAKAIRQRTSQGTASFIVM
jgi:hypothetical protein